MRLLPLIALPALTALTAVALSGCSFAPRGPIVSEDRQIDAATAVVLDTSGNLTISEGEPALTIHASQAVLDQLTSSVKNGVLELGVKPGTPEILLGKVRYDLTLPSLESLEINGSGDISSDLPGDSLAIDISGSGDLNIDDIDASSVTLDISGSGDVELSGRSDTFTLTIDGSADVHADELETAAVTIEIDGSGDIAVAASDALEVSISGSGTVLYEGRPQVTQNISGSGEVSRL